VGSSAGLVHDSPRDGIRGRTCKTSGFSSERSGGGEVNPPRTATTNPAVADGICVRLRKLTLLMGQTFSKRWAQRPNWQESSDRARTVGNQGNKKEGVEVWQGHVASLYRVPWALKERGKASSLVGVSDHEGEKP